MIDSSFIFSQIEENLKLLPDCHNLQDFIPEFYQFWQSLGQLIQQQLVQSKIEEIEAKYLGAKKKKKKRYYTPLGEMVIQRRAYPTTNGLEFKVDRELKLPSDKWLSPVDRTCLCIGRK